MELPPGLRFRPTKEELIMHYLSPKIRRPNLSFEGLVLEVDIYKFHPAELTATYDGNGHDGTWYFFTQVNRRFKNGGVVNRETPRGTWKASSAAVVTGCKGVKIGVIKKLVFWETKDGSDGKKEAAKRKTDWMLHEYRVDDSALSSTVDSCVLCKIYHKKKNEVDANEGNVKGCQTLKQILPILASQPLSVVRPQPKNQTFDDNLAKHHHTDQPKPESTNPVPCLDSVSYLLQGFGSDGFSEAFPDSALNFHAVLNQLSCTAKQVQAACAYDSNLSPSNFDMGGLLNTTKSSNPTVCRNADRHGTMGRSRGQIM